MVCFRQFAILSIRPFGPSLLAGFLRAGEGCGVFLGTGAGCCGCCSGTFLGTDDWSAGVLLEELDVEVDVDDLIVAPEVEAGDDLGGLTARL